MEKAFKTKIVHKDKSLSIIHKNKIIDLKSTKSSTSAPIGKLIVKYKFDKSIYDNLIPTFDVDFNNYIIVDDYVDIKNSVVTRSIYKSKSPTIIKFGNNVQNEKTSSLLEIVYLDTTSITNMNNMFDNCNNLRKISVNDWIIANTTPTENMFKNCSNLEYIMMHNSNYYSVNKIIEQLPTRSQDELGYLFLSNIDDMTKVDIESGTSKYWTIRDEQSSFILGRSKLGVAKLFSDGKEDFILDESALDVDTL
jgi:hypothetical protein